MFRALVISVLIALGTALPMDTASAMTCTRRHQECLRNCQKLFPNRPACTSQCADTLPKCMISGCWINKMANKCGYTKS
jgi:hypothetical protein